MDVEELMQAIERRDLTVRAALLTLAEDRDRYRTALENRIDIERERRITATLERWRASGFA